MTIPRSIPWLALATLAAAAPAETQNLSDGLTRTLVAREPLLKNPVVVSVDVDGSIYVAETARRLAADLDIREFKQWIPDTLALRSVEERQAFYRKELVPGKDWSKTSLKDRNGDGVVDVKDLTAISEKILRLTDTDGDGMMDKSQVFAEGFNSEVTGIAAGVLAWRGDVYASIIPDLWKLRDTKGSGMADQREALLTGFGVHIAYAGHDMHGLTLGPDGKIYWTIGDKGVNVVSKEGRRWEAQDLGSVLRCNPDGTGFEVFARGIRNVQQIAFDDYGNIFGVDNDSDAKGEKERFVYIAEGSDSGWRCYYQYRGSDYNPWMAESMSVPSGPDQPAFITPPICSYMDGPSGFAHDPGTALNERHRGSFFMTGFPAGLLYAFKAEPQGAGFKMTDSHIVDKGPAYVGCNFGPDGALYLADWAGGYPLKEKGAVWKLDDPTVKDNPIRREVAEMLKTGPSGISDADLVKRLKHPDQRIRCDAQGELAKRPTGPALLETSAASWKEEPLACSHALWGLTQAKVFSPSLLTILLSAKAENTRAQAARWAGETAGKPVPELIPLLRDHSAAVRYRAAVAIGKLGMDEALDAVLAMLAENSNRDSYLRHAGVLALTGMKPDLVAAKVLSHKSPAVRLAGAVVFRRLGSAEGGKLLADPDPAVVNEAARAIYDDSSIPAGLPALAAVLDKNVSVPAPAIRRAIATNRRVGDEASAIRLSKYAADSSKPADLRVAALEALASWPKPLRLDSVDGHWHPVPTANPEIARKAFTSAEILEHDKNPAIAKAAATAAKALGIRASPDQLARDVEDSKSSAEVRLAALADLKAAASDRFAVLARKLLDDPSAELRGGASNLLGAGAALDYAIKAATRSKDTFERQNAIALLAASSDPKAVAVLKSLLAAAAATPELQLDLLTVAAVIPALKPEADALTASLAAKGDLGPFLPSLMGGNSARGRKVFEANLAASCTACHRIGEAGSNVGPPLTEVSKKGREYILESIVLPQAKIAPGYGVTSITKKDGSIISGAPKSETKDAVVLVMPDGKDLSIPKSGIASQTPPVSPMPPMSAILKPAEIRDLVEFLSARN